MSDSKNIFQSGTGIVVAVLLVVISFGAGAMFMKLQNNSSSSSSGNDDNQVVTKEAGNNQSNENLAAFEAYAKQLGLEIGEFKKCLTDHETADKVKADIDQSIGVSGTPSFFVNGNRVKIDQTVDKTWFDGIKRYVEAELSGSPLSGESVEISVTDKDPQKGNLNADITVVEYSDFQCPYCASAGKPAVEQLLSEYGDKVKLVWKNYPLGQSCNHNVTRPFHPRSCIAAEAAMCAYEQGKFWEMHDLLFSNQSSWSK